MAINAPFCPPDLTDLSPLRRACPKGHTRFTSTLHGYIRTSRRLITGEPGNDRDTQGLQLLDAGVPAANLYRDLGVSGSTGATTRQGWRSLNSHLHPGDVVVVASVDRVGRGWIDVMGVIRELRDRGIRNRSLAASDQTWTRYLDADPETPEAMIGDVLATVFTGAAQQEPEAIRRRTKAGMDRAQQRGSIPGGPRSSTRPVSQPPAGCTVAGCPQARSPTP